MEPLLLHCTAESSKEYKPIEGALCVGPGVTRLHEGHRAVSTSHLGESGWTGNWAKQAKGSPKTGGHVYTVALPAGPAVKASPEPDCESLRLEPCHAPGRGWGQPVLYSGHFH